MLRTALALSAALHGLFGWWVEVRGSARPPVWRETVDSWTGPGIEVDAVVDPPNALAETSAPRDAETANAANTTNAAESTPTRARIALATHPAEASRDADVTAIHGTRLTTHDAKAPRETEVRSAKKPIAVARVAPTTSPKEPARTAAPESHAVAASGSSAVHAATSSGSSDGATAANAASSATTSGAFGAQGLPQGVRHLPKAFTRALSIADRGDPRWLALPPGPAGEARVEIPVDDDGKLGELAYRDETEREKLAPVVRHLLENTRLLLESGHFSLDPADLRAGVQRLRVRVEVVEATGTNGGEGDPNGLKELEYEAPTATRPGRGSFALNSGRRVIGWVYVE